VDYEIAFEAATAVFMLLLTGLGVFAATDCHHRAELRELGRGDLDLRDDIDDLRERLRAVREAALESQNEDLQAQVVEMEAALSAVEAEFDALQGELQQKEADLVAQAGRHEAEREAWRRGEQQLRERIRQAEAERDRAAAEAGSTRTDLDAAQEQVEALRARLRRLEEPIERDNRARMARARLEEIVRDSPLHGDCLAETIKAHRMGPTEVIYAVQLEPEGTAVAVVDLVSFRRLTGPPPRRVTEVADEIRTCLGLVAPEAAGRPLAEAEPTWEREFVFTRHSGSTVSSGPHGRRVRR